MSKESKSEKLTAAGYVQAVIGVEKQGNTENFIAELNEINKQYKSIIIADGVPDKITKLYKAVNGVVKGKNDKYSEDSFNIKISELDNYLVGAREVVSKPVDASDIDVNLDDSNKSEEVREVNSTNSPASIPLQESPLSASAQQRATKQELKPVATKSNHDKNQIIDNSQLKPSENLKVNEYTYTRYILTKMHNINKDNITNELITQLKSVQESDAIIKGHDNRTPDDIYNKVYNSVNAFVDDNGSDEKLRELTDILEKARQNIVDLTLKDMEAVKDRGVHYLILTEWSNFTSISSNQSQKMLNELDSILSPLDLAKDMIAEFLSDEERKKLTDALYKCISDIKNKEFAEAAEKTWETFYSNLSKATKPKEGYSIFTPNQSEVLRNKMLEVSSSYINLFTNKDYRLRAIETRSTEMLLNKIKDLHGNPITDKDIKSAVRKLLDSNKNLYAINSKTTKETFDLLLSPNTFMGGTAYAIFSDIKEKLEEVSTPVNIKVTSILNDVAKKLESSNYKLMDGFQYSPGFKNIQDKLRPILQKIELTALEQNKDKIANDLVKEIQGPTVYKKVTNILGDVFRGDDAEGVKKKELKLSNDEIALIQQSLSKKYAKYITTTTVDIGVENVTQVNSSKALPLSSANTGEIAKYTDLESPRSIVESLLPESDKESSRYSNSEKKQINADSEKFLKEGPLSKLSGLFRRAKSTDTESIQNRTDSETASIISGDISEIGSDTESVSAEYSVNTKNSDTSTKQKDIPSARVDLTKISTLADPKPQESVGPSSYDDPSKKKLSQPMWVSAAIGATVGLFVGGPVGALIGAGIGAVSHKLGEKFGGNQPSSFPWASSFAMGLAGAVIGGPIGFIVGMAIGAAVSYGIRKTYQSYSNKQSSTVSVPAGDSNIKVKALEEKIHGLEKTIEQIRAAGSGKRGDLDYRLAKSASTKSDDKRKSMSRT